MSEEILLHKDLSDIYNMSYIIKERKTLAEENHLRIGGSNIEANKNLDIIISLIYLYLPYCNDDEIPYWLKKEWNIDLSLRNIQEIKYKYQSKRLFQKFSGIYVLDTLKVTQVEKEAKNIIIHDGLYYTNSLEHIDKFIYFSGSKKQGSKKKLNIGSKLSLIELKKIDGTFITISEALEIKRFNYMYNISDMSLMELYLNQHNSELSLVKKNQFIITSQCNFIIKFNKINNKYFL